MLLLELRWNQAIKRLRHCIIWDFIIYCFVVIFPGLCDVECYPTLSLYTAACNRGKAILYIRSILDDINIPQEEATTLFIDNNGALLMANAQQPTRRTRHMDIKHFALTDWVERDLLIMKP